MEQNNFNIKSFNLNTSQLNVSKIQVGRGMGYGEELIPEPFDVMTDELLSDINEIINIKAGYRIFPSEIVFAGKDKLVISETEFDIKKIIGAHLKNIETVAIFAATIGENFDSWTREMNKEGYELEGYIADTIGSEVVEAAADWLENNLNLEMQDLNMSCSNRLSPGYCGWSVAEQKKLFSFLPKNFLGIKLTDSSLMVPIKSVSGIIGIGKEVKRLDYQCNICSLENCYKRFRDKIEFE